jgi:hypothetical protein
MKRRYYRSHNQEQPYRSYNQEQPYRSHIQESHIDFIIKSSRIDHIIKSCRSDLIPTSQNTENCCKAFYEVVRFQDFYGDEYEGNLSSSAAIVGCCRATVLCYLCEHFCSGHAFGSFDNCRALYLEIRGASGWFHQCVKKTSWVWQHWMRVYSAVCGSEVVTSWRHVQLELW